MFIETNWLLLCPWRDIDMNQLFLIESDDINIMIQTTVPKENKKSLGFVL